MSNVTAAPVAAPIVVRAAAPTAPVAQAQAAAPAAPAVRVSTDGNATAGNSRASGLSLPPAQPARAQAAQPVGEATPVTLPKDGREFMDTMQAVGRGIDAQGGADLPGGLRVDTQRGANNEVTGHTLKGADGQVAIESSRSTNPDGSKVEWAKTPDGRLIGSADFDAQGRLQGGTVRTEQNDKGEFKEARFDEKGVVGASVRTATETGFVDTHLDAQGRQTAQIMRDKEGKAQGQTSRTYGADGVSYTETTQDATGKTVGQTTGTLPQK